MRRFLILLATASVAGCAGGPDWLTPRKPAPQPEATAVQPSATSAAVRPPQNARTVDDFDTTTAAEKAAASAPATGGRALGTTIASLGAAGEPGFWLKTPLAATPGPGRVVYPANGKSVNVDLLPLGDAPGAGSRMSLSAMRVLDAPLTGLPEVTVYALD